MKIGLDVDGVILNSENEIRVKSELYDLLELQGKGVVCTNEFLDKDRYEWSKAELDTFREKYFVRASNDSYPMPGAKQILEMLRKDKHELIIITARGLSIKDMKKAAEEKFKEYNLKFEKYYWAVENKLDICKKENIDIMIDDKASICKLTSKNKIKTLYFRDVNREKLEENEYLKEVNNWGEIYRYIYNLNMEEK